MSSEDFEEHFDLNQILFCHSFWSFLCDIFNPCCDKYTGPMMFLQKKCDNNAIKIHVMIISSYEKMNPF